MPETNPQQAHDHLQAAVEFVGNAHMPIDPRDSEHLDLSYLEEDGRGSARLNLDSYEGADQVKFNIEETDRESSTRQNLPQGIYDAYLFTKGGNAVNASATVERNGVTHTFKGENAEKAATLITNLAAKRLGNRATQHANEVAAAQEAFRKVVK